MNESIQKELEFKEPIEGYTLAEIETVLLKALDKPEVDAILIDFKRFKSNNDIIAQEVTKKQLKKFEMPDQWFIVITNENLELVKEWRKNRRYSYTIGGAYGTDFLGNYMQCSNSYYYLQNEPESVKITNEQFVEFMLYESYKKSEIYSDNPF